MRTFSNWAKTWLIRYHYQLALLLIMVMGILLRIRFLHHQLIIDEANNYLCLKTMAGLSPGPPFDQVFTYHPPLYLTFAFFLSKVSGLYRPALYQCFSITVSILSLMPLYLLGKEIFNRRAALFACFALALFPASMIMDSWIKVDPLEVLCAVAFLYFLVKGSSLWSGLFLGLALLSKETVLMVLFGIAIFLLITRDRHLLKIFLTSLAIGAALSFWWYLFISPSRGRFLSFILGTHPEVSMFNYGSAYYISGLLKDLGPFFILSALVGLGCVLYRYIAQRRRLPLLPATIVLTNYAFISLIKGKPPWMITTILPFLALLCGVGIDAFLEKVRNRGRKLLIFSLTFILISGIVPALALSYDDYMLGRQASSYRFAQQLRHEAERIDSLVPVDDSMLIYFGAGVFPNSIFLSYISPRSIGFIDDRISYLDLSGYVNQEDIRWVVIFCDGRGLEIATFLYNYESFFFEKTGYYLLGKRIWP